jgi:hypothetical protein
MTPPQSTDPTDPRTDPFRWDHQRIASVFDHFCNPDHPTSQRHFAKQHDIPRSTLGSWLRQPDPDGLDPDLVAFFRSTCGLALPRRIVLALFVVFLFRGCCGLRSLGLFLRLSQLDRFVASSHGALHELAQTVQADLSVFSDQQRVRLAEGMAPRDIALVADEHFHAGHPCLVAIEPASNFILVEQYAESRDAVTWTTVITQALDGLPVTVVLLTSDQAKGLICCASNGLDAQHLPELFHGQRDLAMPFISPLQRCKESVEKELREAEQMLRYWRDEKAMAQTQRRAGCPLDCDWRIDIYVNWVGHFAQEVKACETRQQQAKDAVTGLADVYHPFDPITGAAVSAADMQQRLDKHLGTLADVAVKAELGSKATTALGKAQGWTRTLVAAVAWFWSAAVTKVEEMDLPEQAERVVNEQLLPGLYWQEAARRGRTAEERREKEELAERLLAQAWQKGGPLGRLAEEKRQEVQRVGGEVVGLFCRSSSCVEGRNGRLSLQHHGQCRLSGGRLKALTTIHNYLVQRPDGTTAAQRFFGQKPCDLFCWLLQHLPDLPRPAAKRPRNVPLPAHLPG